MSCLTRRTRGHTHILRYSHRVRVQAHCLTRATVLQDTIMPVGFRELLVVSVLDTGLNILHTVLERRAELFALSGLEGADVLSCTHAYMGSPFYHYSRLRV